MYRYIGIHNDTTHVNVGYLCGVILLIPRFCSALHPTFPLKPSIFYHSPTEYSLSGPALK